VVQINHPNPFFDDSYAVNSANLGPYGDAIMYELIPAIEKQFRGLAAGWARGTFGGSTGGWESLAVQVMYPDSFNGVHAACPDPISFTSYTTIDIYSESNAFYYDAPFKRTERPGQRDQYSGQTIGYGHPCVHVPSLHRHTTRTNNAQGRPLVYLSAAIIAQPTSHPLHFLIGHSLGYSWWAQLEATSWSNISSTHEPPLVFDLDAH
jgi:hypothetical protein